MESPKVLEAHRWVQNGDHPDDYAEDTQGLENGVLRTFTGAERKAKGWEGAIVRYYRRPDVSGKKICGQCSHTMHEHGWIDQGGAGRDVCPGDWIVTMSDGRHLPYHEPEFLVTFVTVAIKV